jgi:hypothetical protein
MPPTISRVLRGQKLQLAMHLVAQGKMNHWDIARQLGISSKVLELARDKPFFEARVDEIRRSIRGSGGHVAKPPAGTQT